MEYPINKITTLCYLINDKSEVLLIMKKRGFGVGKWNGPGGKVEIGENPKDSMIREVEEETGFRVANPRELGYIEFIWPEGQAERNQRCYIYLTEEFGGEVKESEECQPAWFAINQIPYDQMWDDDKYWYPDTLAGKAVKKRFFFDKNNKVLKHEDI